MVLREKYYFSLFLLKLVPEATDREKNEKNFSKGGELTK